MKIDEKTIIEQLHDPKQQRKAFEAVVNQYGQQLYWQIRRMVISHEDADDILQETFVKAWMNISQFEGRAQLSTWLSRIAINQTLDFLRKQRLQTQSLEQVPYTAASIKADTYFDGDQAQAALYEAIAQLPDVQRTVFNLRYFEEMPYSQISQILQTSEGALKASYHIAAEKVKQKVKLKLD